MSNPKKYQNLLIHFLALFFAFVFIEIGFKIFSKNELFNTALLRICLFLIVPTVILSTLLLYKPTKPVKIFIIVFISIIAIYSIAQLGFTIFLGNYVSLKTSADQGGKVTEYVVEFIKFIKPQYYLLLLSPILYGIFVFKFPIQIQLSIKTSILFLVSSILFNLVLVMSLQFQSLSLVNLKDLYTSPSFIDLALNEFGTMRFLYRDIFYAFQGDNDEVIIIDNSNNKGSQVVIEEEDKSIDDSNWITASQNEQNESIKQIDNYLLQQVQHEDNEYTGMFEGMNLIYIMIEAFDYIAVDRNLTPTLYKMQQEGWDFSNYYTPKYSCTTGESEFIGLVSLVPDSSVCTPNSYSDNSFTTSILSLFNHEDYYVSAYHNWEDEFYDRRELYQYMGIEDYYNIENLNFNIIQGWQSDVELMTEALPHFINEEKFMSFIVTSSMHFPYDSKSTLGDRYLSEINEVYPDYPIEIKRYLSKAMEFDKAMETLLNELENAGKLDNTLIVLFADHHPLKTSLATLTKYTQQLDRSVGLNEDRTPLIIYNPNLTPTTHSNVASTFDILPTIANLYNLNYDSRLYIGDDIFTNDDDNIVIFTNGNWVSSDGYYVANKDEFISTSNKSVSKEKINEINTYVSNSFKISKLIYKTDYFKHRPFILHPYND